MILRTYMCDACGFGMEVELTADQWDAPPPDCPECAVATYQELKPPAIGGSNRARAVKMAEDIAEKDFGVADFKSDGRQGGRPKVRYKVANVPPSTWAAPNANLAHATQLGRESRLKYGSGMDVLKEGLKSGDVPDMIALSKARSARIW